MKSFVLCLLSLAFVFVATAAPNDRRQSSASASAETTLPNTSVESGGRSIEFNAAPVDMVFEVYQDLVGKTVLKDPQAPQATITLKPQKGQDLSVEDKVEAIETVLEMNGIHMEPYGEKFVRAIPRKDVRKDGIPLIMDSNVKLGETTKVVSFMIHFENIAIDEAQKALEGFKSANGILLVFERTNSILVTDTEQIINRMREIAKAIDIASQVTEVVEYIQIKYANASEVKQVIDSIVQESMKDQEKNGNVPANQPAATSMAPFGRSPLASLRPGRPNQPAAPVNNASLVMTVSDADRGMIRGKVVTIADDRSNKILIITNRDNMKFFKEVITALDVETTPDTVVKVYRLKYAEAEDVSDMINDLIGNSASSKDSKGNQNQNAKNGTSGSATRGTTTPTPARTPANQRTGEAKAGELNKENTTVLADKRINGLVVMTQKELVPTIEQIIESMDIKLSQVLIETVIIEVQLGDGLNTGIDWVQNGRFKTQGTSQITGMNGLPLYNFTDGDGHIRKFEWAEGMPETRETSDEYGATTTWTRFGDALTKVTDITKKGNFWTGTAGYASMMGGGAGNGAMAADIVSGVATNVFSSAFNYIFKSDKLNLSAIIQASKTDNRAKYLASPIVMTLDNKEATIDATESRKFFSGYETSSSYSTYMRTPKYDSKDIGIQIKVTPKINPNGTVMLNIEEEYSQVIEGGQSILVGDGAGKELIDTALSRKMSADALLENMQTVILCGLTETTKSESETGIPILKDIPIIGKWLFGSVRQNENRKELLVFMTPYVLDDAQAAQAEALRRKKTLSDATPWEDHGWSLSELADPVSKKEQMRRIKDEWKKQDEERRTKVAIEKMKVERAQKLQAMSVEERTMWLKMHKAELDAEAQEELEEKMLDEKSQEELKKLAAEVRAKMLARADEEIKKMETATAAENERGKLDAEKEKKEESGSERQGNP